MEAEVTMGLNQTGIAMSPSDAKETIEAAEQAPAPLGAPADLAEVRRRDAEEADVVGSVPLPGTVKGALRTVIDAVRGQKPSLLLDKLGERLAFERAGTRLYEAILIKYDARGSWAGGPVRAELEQFRAEELDHVHLLLEAHRQLGADPTAMTPGADVMGVATGGLLEVAGDPRTTLPETLEALLLAELADNESWTTLGELARRFGHGELVERIERACLEEANHLENVRRWLTRGMGVEAETRLAA